MYRTRRPIYQALMLNSLLSIWTRKEDRLLDVGGGTGVVAQAMAQLFPVKEVHAIDLVDRFCPSLSVATARYDGKTIPFDDGFFSAATLNNVLHHVPVDRRAGLLREIRRVVDGPLYIKDHLSVGSFDDLRLTTLDAIGNIPFGGMLWAKYLRQEEWNLLSDASGYHIAACAERMPYRKGIGALLFPNKLEITMRLEPR